MGIPAQVAGDAAALLGAQIRARRTAKGWTQAELASRVGTQQKTISAIEAGRMTVAIGTVFTAAATVGVELFGQDSAALACSRRQADEVIRLLPRRVVPGNQVADDDF